MARRCLPFVLLAASAVACAGPATIPVGSPLPLLLTPLPSASLSASKSVAPTIVRLSASTTNAQLSPAPSMIGPVLSGRDVWPVEWSPDGTALIAVEQSPEVSTVHVFDQDGHEFWSTPGSTAAWTGPSSLAFMRVSDTQAGIADLFDVTLPSGAPTKVPGSYLGFITASMNGRLAVPDSEAPSGSTFDILNPDGGHFGGDPHLWSPAGDKLAIIRGPEPYGGYLAILDSVSGSITRTNLDVAENGFAFNRTGTKVMVCVYVDQSACVPTLASLDGTEIARSAMSGELLNAGELPDGRWVGGNPAFAVVIWDPGEFAETKSLGTGVSSVSPTGTVAIITDAMPSRSPIASEIPIIWLPGSGAASPVWSPAGDSIAYSVNSSSGEEMRIARLP